jgi:catalase (peroxidase I)
VELIEDDDNRAPFFVRLAWHCSGTYAKGGSPAGGSDGARMRFNPEKSDGANAGLDKARDLLEPIKAAHPSMSYADLYAYAGAVAIEAIGGPHIPFRFGRTDYRTEAEIVAAKEGVANGRLPDAAQGSDHLRSVFYRMGINEQEIVALSGAHTLGRCHTDRSGFEGPWTFAPTTMSNQYFTLLNEEIKKPGYWTVRKWDGPKQYADPTGELMMLPTDMALVSDDVFRPLVQAYAKDEELFFQDFAAAFSRLLHLGVDSGKLSKSI